MHKSHVATFAALWLLVLATESSFADEKKNEEATWQPQQILDDCVQAVQAGDFQRYVGHLSEQELRLQAGFVLFLTSTMSPRPNDYEPEVFLLTRAVNDLVKQYSVPESERNHEQQAAEEARQEMPGQLLQAAFNPNPNGVLEACIQASGILKDPKRFLVAALTETARPTHISGGELQKRASPVDIGDRAKAYGKIKWIVYTRGDYALALASAPQADTQSVPQLPEQDAANADSALPAAPPSEESPTASLRIVFRKIEKEWKIDGLLTTTGLTPTVSTLPPQADFVPVPTYSSVPRRVPVPYSSSQPTPNAYNSR